MFQKVGAICNQSVMSHTIAILTNICTDSVIRLKLMNCDEIWLFCVNILVSEAPSRRPSCWILHILLTTSNPQYANICISYTSIIIIESCFYANFIWLDLHRVEFDLQCNKHLNSQFCCWIFSVGCEVLLNFLSFCSLFHWTIFFQKLKFPIKTPFSYSKSSKFRSLFIIQPHFSRLKLRDWSVVWSYVCCRKWT